MRYDCYQSALIALFFFHTTLNYSKLTLLRWARCFHVPYLILNVLYFYITTMLTEMKINFGFIEFDLIKFGIYTFDSVY